PGEPALRELQAEAAVNLMVALVGKDPAALLPLVDDLEGLARAHPGEAVVEETLAQGVCLLVHLRLETADAARERLAAVSPGAAAVLRDLLVRYPPPSPSA
ncbi:MAG: hypothetical protein KDG89_11445, partial [Geminicoccaceae bacterium]|nr:hypothetical protein [Geminicoccaceae bacterium]